MRRGLVDSMVLIDYDNGHEKAIEWWITKMEEGWEFYLFGSVTNGEAERHRRSARE